MAGEPSSAYPDFSELYHQARDMEKRLLQVRPSKITGSVSLSSGSDLYPEEFESYTYAYLLSEAQKVERRLFSSSMQEKLGQPAKGAQTPAPSDAAVPPAQQQYSHPK